MIQIFNYDCWLFQKFKWAILIKNKKKRKLSRVLLKLKILQLDNGWKFRDKVKENYLKEDSYDNIIRGS